MAPAVDSFEVSEGDAAASSNCKSGEEEEAEEEAISSVCEIASF